MKTLLTGKMMGQAAWWGMGCNGCRQDARPDYTHKQVRAREKRAWKRDQCRDQGA